VGEEAAAIREAAACVLAGETLSSIVRDWNRRGLTTANGGPWRVNSLSELLVQPRLVDEPSILAEETHVRLVQLHASRRKGPRRPTRRYLLTGLLRCWRCGAVLRGTPRARGADLYVCPGPPHGGCSGTAVTANHAEDAVGNMVLTRLDSAELRGLHVDDTVAVRELSAHRQRLLDLGELWASGKIDRQEWLSLKGSVGHRVRSAEAEVARLQRIATFQKLTGTGAALRTQWPGMAIDTRRSIVQSALEHVVVLAAEPPKRVFRPERLQPFWLE
jgi:site-specific DNA recombinase